MWYSKMIYRAEHVVFNDDIYIELSMWHSMMIYRANHVAFNDDI